MRIVKNGDVHVSVPLGVPKREVEAFIEQHRDWIAEAQKKTCERQKQRAEFYNQLPLSTRTQADEALQRLKSLVEPMVERHSQVMGVKPRSIYYKPMISRWGVCNVKAQSLYLDVLPAEVLCKMLVLVGSIELSGGLEVIDVGNAFLRIIS